MKGISAVIATILMLMITVAMVGVAYMYISGMFTTRTAQAISIASSDCAGGDINILIRNDGTEIVTLDAITISLDGAAGAACVAAGGNLAAGSMASCTAIEAAAGSHTIRIVGPANAITGTIQCTS